ncbi:hypothetical protein L218DRAFT_1004910 [Marasmius fiardii PR-910]|nr:hypothetical protein L218DRAFT_1004910 [Marasmius fiardii PR-910]
MSAPCSPRIWVSIDVCLCDIYPRGGMKLVEIFLANSASYPLNLQVNLSCDRSESAQTSWEALIRHISRWKQLHFKFSEESQAGILGDQVFMFDNLVSFHSGRDTGPYYTNKENGLFWQALAQAPKLVEVQTWRFYPLHFIPYHQLTTLVIGCLRSDDFKDLIPILEVSIKLHTFKLLLFSTHSHRVIDIPRRIKLPSLRTLSICPGYDSVKPRNVAINNPFLKILLASLEMPSLSSFKLAYDSHSETLQPWPPSLLDLLQQITTLRCFHFHPGSPS